MKQIAYLDNAATTRIDTKVLEAMLPYMTELYGNPSSSYSIGRESKSAIEKARRQVAEILGVAATSIYFTSGGTESNNTAIASSVNELGCNHIITSPIEHHAVLNTVKHYANTKMISYSYVKLNAMGEVNLEDLESQLREHKKKGNKCLVSLMHANNEIGTLLEMRSVGKITSSYGAIFHSDCVQTIGHYPITLTDVGVHFASASGHKFHGPKGTGILYVSAGTKFESLIHGGGQERKKRAGTENVPGIVGFTKALELAMDNFSDDQTYITSLNSRMKNALKTISNDITFNNTESSLYTILSANFPAGTNTDFMLALLDNEGIYASGGSACSSGDDLGSHVIAALKKDLQGATIRFSFSKMTEVHSIDHAITSISKILSLKDQMLSI